MNATELAIGGMTCASCAARVQKKLNRLDGVTAAVNLATETAWVQFPAAIGVGDLIAVVEQAGYTAEVPPQPGGVPSGDGTGDGAGAPADGDAASAKRGPDAGRLAGLSRLAAAATVFAAVMVAGLVPALQFTGWEWVALALVTPVAAWAAWPFHRAAVVNARHGAATMDTLVSLGVTAAYGWSLYALVTGTGHLYLEVAAGVTTLILLGRRLESRARRDAGASVRALLELGARDAAVLRDGAEHRIPAARLAVGDLMVVRPGERVPADGVVADGRSAVDASMITGEPVPVEVGPGDTVTGGCVNEGGRLLVRATRVGAGTQLAQIARLVAQAQAGKAGVQRLADRVSGVFVPVVLALAVATLAGWLAAGAPAGTAISAAVAVLIIACPCAMGLATPTALLVGTGRGAQLGILIKGPEVLESTRRVDTVVLDKTGTVTTGRMTLTSVLVPGGAHPAGPGAAEVLRLAGAIEDASEHPVARAITAAARAAGGPAGLVPVNAGLKVATAPQSAATRPGASSPASAGPRPGITRPAMDGRAPGATRQLAAAPDASGPRPSALPAVSDFASVPGSGVSGVVDGRLVAVGQAGWLQAAHGLRMPRDLAAQVAREAAAGGKTIVAAGWDGEVRGALVVADVVKPTSAAAVARLRDQGLRVALLTGDNEQAARATAAAVGIAASDVIAGVAPAGKVSAIKALQESGRVVAMAGDGVNDAAALAQADLGLAMGTGTDAAIEASDLTLVRGDLLLVPDAIALSRRTLAIIKGNLAWAFGYNVAAIPLAALGLLNPMIAAAAMGLSSVLVVANSLRLRSALR
ncbi:MAG TPA: heavy metal translocating P-type ATPase [Trebonia sp.]|nr:heavy metal translocating P-type ATPase [Trebonia sp.]